MVESSPDVRLRAKSITPESSFEEMQEKCSSAGSWSDVEFTKMELAWITSNDTVGGKWPDNFAEQITQRSYTVDIPDTWSLSPTVTVCSCTRLIGKSGSGLRPKIPMKKSNGISPTMNRWSFTQTNILKSQVSVYEDSGAPSKSLKV